MADENPTTLRTPWTTSLDSTSALQRRVALQSEQLRLLGSAIHVAGLGIAIMTPAVEAIGPRIAFVNDGFLELYGYERTDVIGQTPIVFNIIDEHEAILNSLLEHVFAHQKGLMGLIIRTIGLARAREKIGLANLAYNMRRFVWLQGRSAPG